MLEKAVDVGAARMVKLARALERRSEGRPYMRRGVRWLKQDQLLQLLESRRWRLISPGGAAGIPGVSRVTMYDWIKRGHVRAWGTRRGELYLDVGDVVRYALERGYKVAAGWRKYGEGDE